MDDELSATEAAAVKGVSRTTINNAIRSGRLLARVERSNESIRVRWLIKRSDLDAWEPFTPQERGALSGEVRRRRRDERKA